MRVSILLAAFAVALHLGAKWEKALVWYPDDGVITYARGDDDDGPSNGSIQRLRPGDPAGATYTFKNFNGDRLTIDFQLPKSAWTKYEGGFGYYKKDLAEIDAWHNQARDGAYKYAVKSKKSQAQLDAALKSLQKEREGKVREYMASRGFRILPGNVLSVDVPSMVKRNAAVMNTVAQAFERVAEQRRYDQESLLGATASLVQTALSYRIPDKLDPDGRNTGGMLQPATALLRGWGDCDTKSALLSSILANWPQMRLVGVAVPGHYLMAVLRIPGKGDAFVEHQGLQYVLIEPAGPAWLPPGQVAQTTIPLLEAGDGYRIEPFF